MKAAHGVPWDNERVLNFPFPFHKGIPLKLSLSLESGTPPICLCSSPSTPILLRQSQRFSDKDTWPVPVATWTDSGSMCRAVQACVHGPRHSGKKRWCFLQNWSSQAMRPLFHLCCAAQRASRQPGPTGTVIVLVLRGVCPWPWQGPRKSESFDLMFNPFDQSVFY